MPCAFRCLVTLNPQELDESLRQRLLFSKQEIRRWGKLNMLLIGNRSAKGRRTFPSFSFSYFDIVYFRLGMSTLERGFAFAATRRASLSIWV